MKTERYVRRRRDDFEQKTPLVGKIILFLAGFVMMAMILLLLTTSKAEAQQVRVYCKPMFGPVVIRPGQCFMGETMIGIVE